MSTTTNEQLIELNVSGMHCNNCALSVHKLLEKKGFNDIFVDFSNNEVKFKAEDESVIPQVIKDIEGLGFKATASDLPLQEKFYEKVENKFYFSLLFSIPLFSHMFLPFHWLHDPYVQLALCLPVYLLGCWHFGKSAINSIRGGVPNMDVLIFIGSSAAFFYSLWGTLQSLGENYLFYETAATIISLVLLGNVFEKRSVTQTTSAIRNLLKFQETTAKRWLNGEMEEIHSHDIRNGDILALNSGDKVPADGEVVWGEGAINESMLTGESMPVEKTKYSTVIGGTIVEKGNFRMLVTRTGKHTALSQIIELMKNAQAAKPPIQKLGDRVAAVFVPVVVGIAAVTFLVTYFALDVSFQKSMLNAIAVLVISCPCAMGLATPTAVMVGLGRAAKNGLLIKGGDTIEKLAAIKQIVFDKTGTITTGNFTLKEIQINQISEQEAINIIWAIEGYSNHPLAVSLQTQLKDKISNRPILTKVEEDKGIGMKAIAADGSSYQLGSKNILKEQPTDSRFNLFLKKDDTLVASLLLEDEIKPGARQLISSLKDMGIRPILLSGDRHEKCKAIAEEVGIEEVYSEKLPGEKLEVIHQLKQKGNTAMMGDGINDAPALTSSDVGISMSDASHIAIQSADVVLLKTDISSAEQLIKISKHTLLTIKQNLFWAFFYNIVAIPVAAMGFLNPMFGALTMAFSDVVVIGNSIRLKTKKIE